jgi:MYXO-CTERM domain-containing protein
VEVYDTASASYQQIMHKDSTAAMPPGEGWDFTSDARTFIQFTDLYCNNVRGYSYSEGSTQLACLCQEPTGDACSVPDNVALGVCPDGLWTCIEGTDVCEPETDCCEAGVPCDTGLEGVCAEGVIVCDGPPLGTCMQVTPASDEVCDLLDNDCDGETDEDLGGADCTVFGGTGRCGNGHQECIVGVLQCVPFGAMPELCNGLDDDCDGDIDNMVNSWSKAAFAPIKSGLSSNGQAAACGFNDVCMCPSGPASGHDGNTFDEYLTAWSPPVCICGEGLEASADGPMSIGEGATSSSSDPAACSTSGGANGGLGALFALALVALRRRR